VDTALYDGCHVPEYYDSLIAKLACQGQSRREALQRMSVALDEMVVEGVKTTIPVHKMVMENKLFADGNYHTQLLDRLLADWRTPFPLTPAQVGAVYVALKRKPTSPSIAQGGQVTANRWRTELQCSNRKRPALYVEGV